MHNAHTRLAQIFDEAGLYPTADIVDGLVYRLAQKSDDIEDKYKQLLDEGHRKQYRTQSGDLPVTTHRDRESYWVYPDGSIMLLDGVHHGTALNIVEKNTKNNNIKLIDDQDYHDFKQNYNNSTYRMLSEMFGVIRVFAEFHNSVDVTCYTVPTQAQINSIENIQQSFSAKKLDIEQYNYVLNQRQVFRSIPNWLESIERFQAANKLSEGTPQSTDFQNTLNSVDEVHVLSREPYWQAMEKRRLQEEYPGEENAPLRKMYERSAEGLTSRIATQGELDFDTPVAEEPVSKESLIEAGKAQLLQAWQNSYPTLDAVNTVEHTDGPSSKNTQSYWVLPDGSRIELGTDWHGDAFRSVLSEHNLESHEGIKLMNSGKGVYHMMGAHYGAIRAWVTGFSNEAGPTIFVSSYTTPTQAQINSIKMIIDGLKVNNFEGDHTWPDNTPSYFKSFQEWVSSTRSKNSATEYSQKIDELNNVNEPLWKSQENLRLIEEYPGDENAPLRRMYQRSAGVRTADDTTEKYRSVIEKGHMEKFPVLRPEERVSKLKKMHSFWLYPDGRVMDLGRTWHERAFNDVMYENHLDEDSDFNTMYTSKDGPYEIMGDYFGMVRVFVLNESIVVTSYCKPTQEQINQIQSLIALSNAHIIKIEQVGHVQGGKLTTNSMSKWIDAISEYRPSAQGHSEYNTLNNEIDVANDSSTNQPLWKAIEQRNLETDYPGEDNDKFRKMYERSAKHEY